MNKQVQNMPTAQELANVKKFYANGPNQRLVEGLNVGEDMIVNDTIICKCTGIKFDDGCFQYGYIDCEFDDRVTWVTARHVKPYTLLDIVDF